MLVTGRFAPLTFPPWTFRPFTGRFVPLDVLPSPRNRRHPPPPPVDEAPSRRQVDEPSTCRRLCPVPPPPLRPLTRRLDAFSSSSSLSLFVQIKIHDANKVQMIKPEQDSKVEKTTLTAALE